VSTSVFRKSCFAELTSVKKILKNDYGVFVLVLQPVFIVELKYIYVQISKAFFSQHSKMIEWSVSKKAL